MYPHLVAEDSDIVRRLGAAAERIGGALPETYYGESAFDRGYLNHVGIACAPYGPGEDDLAHTDHDMASIERTIEAAKVHALVTLDYVAKG